MQYRNESVVQYAIRLQGAHPEWTMKKCIKEAAGTPRLKTGRNNPHQSTKECTRRLRQIEAGKLTFN